MTRLIKPLILMLFVSVGTVAYTQVMLRMGSAAPPPMAPADQQADAIHVDKSDRQLTLLRGGEPIKTYDISMGGSPKGHKTEEGDERTPTGIYEIDWRNPNSIAHLSLHISYPNADDTAQAEARGVSPGGNIMIHGILNGWGMLGPLQTYWNWTNGCIAVTNAEMREIWSLVPDGTVITIAE